MRTSEAMAADILSRRDRFFEKRRARRDAALKAGAFCACAALASCLWLWPPDLNAAKVQGGPLPGDIAAEGGNSAASAGGAEASIGTSDHSPGPTGPLAGDPGAAPDDGDATEKEQSVETGDAGIDTRVEIRAFGDTGSVAVCYAAPKAGTAGTSVPLWQAMEEYGDTVVYAVRVQVLSEAQIVDTREETLTLSQIQSYAQTADPAYGYMLFLSDE